MTVFLSVVIYAAAVVFVIACVARIVMFAKAPIHLRWELYPVPHETPDRIKHGGSYFEEVDWWTRPAHFNFLGELRFMIPEMLFMKGLWQFNRKLWFRSFPFHFGLYLLIGTLALLTLGVVLSIFAPFLMAGLLGSSLQHLVPLTGLAGSALAVAGALALLARRLTDESLKMYTTRADIFNLLFFLVTLGVLSAGYLARPASTPDMIAISRGILSFDTRLQIPGLLGSGLFLAGLLVAYVPLTHMSHFIAKYFTYHSVRWDDAPNRRGEKLETRLAEYLTYRPTWAAAHVQADGVKTWAQVDMINPARETKK
jgi:nitrate reductase gamma subunit